jgi:hypothetical protein
VLQLQMESDVEGQIGTGRYERTGERATCVRAERTANTHQLSSTRP